MFFLLSGNGYGYAVSKAISSRVPVQPTHKTQLTYSSIHLALRDTGEDISPIYYPHFLIPVMKEQTIVLIDRGPGLSFSQDMAEEVGPQRFIQLQSGSHIAGI
ncbi:MAG: hypothetical protein DDT18_01417 [Actinobacteria bacterium]|nr:hypothetical protein [Actinomycetota bacterium]